MIRWIPYAFVRIVLFFILGIYLGIDYGELIDPFYGRLIFLILGASYGIVVWCSWKKLFLPGYKLKVIAGIIGLSAIVIAGFLNVYSSKQFHKTEHLIHIQSPVEFSKLVITNLPEEKANSWKIESLIKAVKTEGEWRTCDSKIMLYVSKRDLTAAFRYGDVLLVKGQPQLVAGPANPEEFDYKRFVGFKNIYHQQFAKSGDVKQIGHEPPSWITYYALGCRQWADAALRQHIEGEREQGLASALVLGVTDGLDNDVLSAYKATGAMHVLAVSGLHVGILYGLLLLVLKPLAKLKFGPWVVAGVSIVVLWGYAFVTGLSPSVLRAVTMFSFVAIARPASYRTNMYNTVAASAFFILWYDPFLLMSVGFQLSYLAVLGIVYMQSGLYNLWEPTNRLLDEIWKVSCVSVAAQLATFSLGLLYFHQFPNYFLLSNLFVIPGSFIVLILGLLILVVGALQPIASALGFILGWIIKLLNYIIFALEDLPFSLIEDVYITPLQCALLLVLIATVLMLIHSRRFKWVITSFFIVSMLCLTQWWHFYKNVNVQKMIVYNVKGHFAIDFIQDGQSYFMGDTALQNDEAKIGFHITPHRTKAGVDKIITKRLAFRQELSGCALMVWKGKTFLQIHDPAFVLTPGIKVDFVIISNDAVKNLQALETYVQMDQLIVDSSNSVYSAEKLLEQAATTKARAYSVLHQGAFEFYL
ncbi:ComEC/Rec2 family competence protein [Chryseolinea sp. H1M3-3]|uniref:ComEC/Rec2 family competence protein n=1 Tax=Chryseolinea sp. H1M3-3 TaxID=3034144 RepID=UPI0023ECD4ED|nr:ComEC/Rec2 family competence protein [Chryseolinea sp. H1M3-3]